MAEGYGRGLASPVRPLHGHGDKLGAWAAVRAGASRRLWSRSTLACSICSW